MESERERLDRLYREMSDEHLEDLNRDRENLTLDGQMALAAELGRRHLEPTPVRHEVIEPVPAEELERGFGPGIPGVFPSGAQVVEQALEVRTESRDGKVSLVSFYDGHELAKACAALEEAAIDPLIEPIAGDALNGVPPRFDVWVDASDEARATSLLRAEMGLFPLAELAGEAEGDGLVGVFESRGEAEEVCAALAAEGFRARTVRSDVAGDGGYGVEVAAAERERALGVVAARLGLA